MPGAEEETFALENYYSATTCARQFIEQNLIDNGIGLWDRALQDVAPFISTELYNAFKLERDNIQLGTSKSSYDYDTYSDYSEESERTEYSDDENNNDTASTMVVDYEVEHRKLTRSYTARPYAKSRLAPGRSATISVLDRGSSLQDLPASLENADHRNQVPSRDKESTATPSTGDLIPISEPNTDIAVDNSNLSERAEGEDQGIPSCAPPRPSTAPAGTLSSKENNDWFGNLQSKAHDFVYGPKKEYWPTHPTKVAILDSGFAQTGPERNAMKPYLSRIKGQENFTTEFPPPTTPPETQNVRQDLTGHGTTVAYQLMKTCPSADIYIAKVTITESPNKKAVPDKSAVARAIRHAATPVAEGGWGVDVINMSFGWDESELPWTPAAINGVSGAIEFADKNGVLLFAAASNYGLTGSNDVFYPARDPRVISVDAEDGLGNPASFALRGINGVGGFRYCAPGLSVRSPWSPEPMCGSSFACPVAAGVAALVLEFARHGDLSLNKSTSVQSALSSARGMTKVFGLMARQAANHPGFGMLYPWHFLKGGQREKAALDIIGVLEVEFGRGMVGFEIVHRIQHGMAACPVVNGSK